MRPSLFFHLGFGMMNPPCCPYLLSVEMVNLQETWISLDSCSCFGNMMNAFLHEERDGIEAVQLGNDCELGCGFCYIAELGSVGWVRQMGSCSSFDTLGEFFHVVVGF